MANIASSRCDCQREFTAVNLFIVAVCGGESTLVGGEPTQSVRRARYGLGQAVRFAVLCTATTHKTIRQLCSYIRIA